MRASLSIEVSKVTDQDNQAARLRYPAQPHQRLVQGIGSRQCITGGGVLLPGGMLGNLAQHVQQGCFAALGAQFDMRCFGEQQSAEPVALAHGTPPQQGRRLGSAHRLECALGGKKHGVAQVNPEQHGAFAFFAKQLGMRATGTRGDAPIEYAHIVALHVGAHLIELHAAPLERRTVTAADGRTNPPGLER